MDSDVCMFHDSKECLIKENGICVTTNDVCYNARCCRFVSMAMSFYLGCTIDGGGQDKIVFEQISAVLSEFGSIFLPGSAWLIGADIHNSNSKFIMDINNIALLHADVAVFLWDFKTISVGIPVEMQLRASANKNFIVYADAPPNMVNRFAYMRAWCKHIVFTIDELRSIVSEIYNNRKTIKGKKIDVTCA